MGSHERLLQLLLVQAKVKPVSEAKVRVRELAGWGLDENEYRPKPFDRSTLDRARILYFLDDELVIEYRRSPLIKTLRITMKETYALQGGDI